jgi:hypothetical protein
MPNRDRLLSPSKWSWTIHSGRQFRSVSCVHGEVRNEWYSGNAWGEDSLPRRSNLPRSSWSAVFIPHHYCHPRSSLASASSLCHPRYTATVALILGRSAMAGQSQTPRMPKWLSHTCLANRLTPLPLVVRTSTDDSMCRPLVDHRPRPAPVPAPRATCSRWAAEASSLAWMT